MSRLKDFERFRAHMNEKILAEGNLETRRFFGLDSKVYEAGRLDRRTKELLGLVGSLVRRCDDCIAYHLIQCHEQGVDRETFYEVFNIGLVVGGSVVIPYMRRAVALLDELEGD
ncbi:MAG: carboxymuconolactone decarboxylase family protein [Candidatus Neomarinimicrobiota bacterium]